MRWGSKFDFSKWVVTCVGGSLFFLVGVSYDSTPSYGFLLAWGVEGIGGRAEMAG